MKKLLVLGLWLSGIVLVVRGSWLLVAGTLEPETETILIVIAIGILVVVFFNRVKKLCKQAVSLCLCFESNLDEKQIEHLLDGEQFEKCNFQNSDWNRYLFIYQSPNWIVFNGTLISKKTCIGN